MVDSKSSLFRQALAAEKPLQIMGAVNAYCALMAKEAGFKALYLSGAGVANASYGLPDLGVTTLDDVLIDVKRIVGAVDLPLLVDIDTGWNDMTATVQAMEQAGVAAVHFEDQVAAKRCGHRPNKTLVSTDEMVSRIKAAVKGRTDPNFFLMARTDALANEGLEATLDRATAYVEAGADGIFFEAVTDHQQYQQFCQKISVPVLANMTEFGKTPLANCEYLAKLGITMVLYPLSAFRAMNKAAEYVYQQIREHGDQQALLDHMQDRETLYQYLSYYTLEDNQVT